MIGMNAFKYNYISSGNEGPLIFSFVGMFLFLVIGLVARLIHFFHYYILFGFDLAFLAKCFLMILRALIKC